MPDIRKYHVGSFRLGDALPTKRSGVYLFIAEKQQEYPERKPSRVVYIGSMKEKDSRVRSGLPRPFQSLGDSLEDLRECPALEQGEFSVVFVPDKEPRQLEMALLWTFCGGEKSRLPWLNGRSPVPKGYSTRARQAAEGRRGVDLQQLLHEFD